MLNLDKKKVAVYIVMAAFFICFDRFLKILALKNPDTSETNLIGDLFKFNFSENYNIAFSLPLGGPALAIIIMLIIIFLLYYCLRLVYEKSYDQAGLLFILIVGASSNLFDRIKYGFVIDYLDLQYFTVFNIADTMIVGSVAILVFLIIKKGSY